MGPTDEELVAAFQQGDASAFDELVSRWDRKIHGAIHRVVGADEDARGLCQCRLTDGRGPGARKRDLVDHRAGRLSADALQARVEFDEY